MLSESFRSNYIFYLVVTVSFILFSSDLLAFKSMRSTALKVEVLNSLAQPDAGALRVTTPLDYINLTQSGAQELRSISGIPDWYVSDEVLHKMRLFKALAGGSETREFRLFGHPRKNCSVIFTRFPISKSVVGISQSVGGSKIMVANSGHITAFNATDCVTGYQSKLAGFILPTDQENFIYIEKNFLSDFEGLFLPVDYFGEIEVANVTQILSQSPYLVTKYFDLPKEGVFVSQDAINGALVLFLEESTGLRFKADDIDAAIKHLYTVPLGRASVAGLTSSLETVLMFSPIVILVVVWLMYRSALARIKEEQSDLWLATDVGDISGILASVIFAALPFLLAVICAILYCSVFQIKGMAFGFLWGFSNSLTFEIGRAPPIGWISTGTGWQTAIAFFWWAILCILLLFYRACLATSNTAVEKSLKRKIE